MPSAKNKSYNLKNSVRESHNCYSYFLNLKSPAAEKLCVQDFASQNYCRRSQPGYASGFPSLKKSDFNCPEIVKRTLSDNPNIYSIKKSESCPAEYYKGAVVVAPKRDYHYYRLNDEGVWTHKPGYKPSTQFDADNKLILDPETANRKYGSLNYSEFCGFTCVPRNPKMKRMRMFNNRDDSMPKNFKIDLIKEVQKIKQNNQPNKIKRNDTIGGRRINQINKTNKRIKRNKTMTINKN